MNGDLHFESHPEFYKRLVNTWGRRDPRVDKVLWLANEAALQQAIAASKDFDYSMASFSIDDWKKERKAIEHFLEGRIDRALDTLKIDSIPARFKEIQLLTAAGYIPIFPDDTQVIYWRMGGNNR